MFNYKLTTSAARDQNVNHIWKQMFFRFWVILYLGIRKIPFKFEKVNTRAAREHIFLKKQFFYFNINDDSN
jgi:hypothetical protein